MTTMADSVQTKNGITNRAWFDSVTTDKHDIAALHLLPAARLPGRAGVRVADATRTCMHRFASLATTALYTTTPLYYLGHGYARDNAGRAARELGDQQETAARLGHEQRLRTEWVAASYRERKAPALVVLDAAQELDRTDGPTAAARAVRSAVRRLGGAVVPAQAAPRDALPVNLSFGDERRRLALAPEGSLARVHLEHLLPGLVGMAGRAVERARQQPPHPPPDPLGGVTGRTEPVDVGGSGLLDALEQAVIATDLDGVVTYCNRAARRLYGWNAAEAVGRPIFELLPSASRAQGQEIFDAVRLGWSWTGNHTVQRPDGSTFLVAVTLTLLHDDSGRRVGMLGLSAAVTDARRAASEETLPPGVRGPRTWPSAASSPDIAGENPGRPSSSSAPPPPAARRRRAPGPGSS